MFVDGADRMDINQGALGNKTFSPQFDHVPTIIISYLFMCQLKYGFEVFIAL